jgi:hypothetical protein
MILQHIIVLTLVGLCLAWVGYQTFQSLRGKKSRVGSCCSKGCSTPTATMSAKQPTGERIAFIPADALRRRR